RGIVAAGILALAFGTGCSSRTQERVVVAPPPRVVERRGPAREVIVGERTHVPRGHAYGWGEQQGYRAGTLRSGGPSYYSRQLEAPGFRAGIVYPREGRYYLPAEDDAKENRHGHHHDRDDDNDNQDN